MIKFFQNSTKCQKLTCRSSLPLWSASALFYVYDRVLVWMQLTAPHWAGVDRSPSCFLLYNIMHTKNTPLKSHVGVRKAFRRTSLIRPFCFLQGVYISKVVPFQRDPRSRRRSALWCTAELFWSSVYSIPGHRIAIAECVAPGGAADFHRRSRPIL